MPERVQLRRTKGWRMPPNTVSVARPSRWGNPFTVENMRRAIAGGVDWSGNASAAFYLAWVRDDRTALESHDVAVDLSVEMFRRLCARFAAQTPQDYAAWLAPLHGKNLACYCPLTYPDGRPHPCHAEVLLELAND